MFSITVVLCYLGRIIPWMSNVGGEEANFMMSSLPDALMSTVAVPFTVRLIGKPELVGTITELSMNIALWVYW